MTFNLDWTSPHADIWKKHLGKFIGQPGVKGLEIGVLEGRSTLWFLDEILTGPGSGMTCVDPFLQTHHSGFQMRREGYAQAKTTFEENTERAKSRIELYPVRSIDYFAIIKRATPRFHFAYVDGSHTLVDATTDILWSFDLLHPGGVLIVDDYEYTDVIDLGEGDVIEPGVTEAVNGFAVACVDKVDWVHRGKQAIFLKR